MPSSWRTIQAPRPRSRYAMPVRGRRVSSVRTEAGLRWTTGSPLRFTQFQEAAGEVRPSGNSFSRLAPYGRQSASGAGSKHQADSRIPRSFRCNDYAEYLCPHRRKCEKGNRSRNGKGAEPALKSALKWSAAILVDTRGRQQFFTNYITKLNTVKSIEKELQT